MVKLKTFGNRSQEVISGRVPYEGYQRGWGLQYDDLSEQIEADPLYQSARKASEGRSLLDAHRAKNLFLLVTKFLHRLDSQDIVEFGTFKGGNAIFLGFLLQQCFPRAKLYALDTFQGMPSVDRTRDLHSPGDFRDADLDGFRRIRDRLKLNIEIHQGLFENTFPAIASTSPRFGLAHLDADIYSAVKYAQNAVWPHMVKGGYVVYDDATVSSCIGATEAVEELVMTRRICSEQVYPHFVFRVGLSGGS